MRLLPEGADPALGAIVAEGFLSRLSFGMANVALLLYANHLGLSLTAIGALASISLVASLAVKPVMGWVADRFGLKRSFAGAIGLRSVVALALVFVVLPWQLFAIRILYGVAQGMRDPALNALLAERGGKKSVATGFAWYATAKSVAGNAGNAAAPFLLFLLPDNFSAVFLIAFVLSVLPLAVVALWVRELEAPAPTAGSAKSAQTPDQRAADQRKRSGALVREFAFVREFDLQGVGEGKLTTTDSILPVGTWLYPTPPGGRAADAGASAPATRAVVPQPAGTAGPSRPTVPWMTIASYIVLGVLISGTAQMLSKLLPVIGKEYAGLDEAQLGGVYTVALVASLVSGPFFGWLTDNVSRKLVLRVRGAANTCSSLIVLAFPNLLGLTFGKAIDDVGKSAFKPAWGAMMAEVAGLDRARRARTMSYLGIAEDLGEAAGPFIAGLLWSAWGLPVALGVRVLLAAATELYAMRLNQSMERRSQVGKLAPVRVTTNRRS